MSRQLMSSEKETSDAVQELERAYKDRINSIDYKSKQEQANYEALEDSLRRQLASLHEEIEMKLSRSSKIMLSKKSQFDQSLSAAQSSKDQELQEHSRRLSLAKDKYFSLKREFDASKSALLSERSGLEIENQKLRSSISDLTHDIEQIQSKLRDVYNKDIHFSKQEIESLKISYDSTTRKLQQEHAYETRELQFRIENSERTIENLLYDIESVKRETEAIRQQSERDMHYLRESVLESNKEVERCEEQTMQLLRGRDEAKEDSLMLSKLTGELETELGKEMKTNTRLNGKLTKLERLVYGKGTRSPSKSRLI